MAIIMGLKPTFRPFTFIVNQQVHVSTRRHSYHYGRYGDEMSELKLNSIGVITYVQTSATSVNWCKKDSILNIYFIIVIYINFNMDYDYN